jgi:hypothetical protein
MSLKSLEVEMQKRLHLPLQDAAVEIVSLVCRQLGMSKGVDSINAL